MGIEQLRVEIDKLDEDLVTLLARRAQLTAQVGAHKRNQGLPLYAPDREASLLAARRRQASAAGVDPQLLEDVLRRIMRGAYSTQEMGFPATGDTQRRIVIVGGGGAMGSLLKSFFERSGYLVRVMEKVDWADAKQHLAGAGLVLISVPIEDTCAVIAALPELPPDCVLADLTSIKRAPIEAMLKRHPGPVVGLHPMFGPDLCSLVKQVIVVCHGRGQDHYQWLLEQLILWGATLHEEPADRHDQAMQVIQAMRHFTTMVYGAFLHRQNVDVPHLLQLSSPIYRLELAMVGRLFAQSPDLYSDIMLQAEKLPQLILVYRECLDELLAIIQAGQRDALIAHFAEIQDYFGDLAQKFLRESSELLRKADDGRDPLELRQDTDSPR